MSDKTKREEESRRLGEMTEREDTRKDRVDDAANADTPPNDPPQPTPPATDPGGGVQPHPKDTGGKRVA